MRVIGKINEPKKFYAGLIYLVSGTAIFFASQSYEIGTATHMGPGYFPILLGIILVGIGVGAIFQSIRATIYDPIPEHKLEPLFLILASIVSFGLLIERTGFVVATFVCLFFACFRRVFSHPIEFIVIFAMLTIFNVIVFVYALQLNIPLWPKFW